ncbi:MAG: PIN domain-containing protein [Bacillota bacterium]
MSKEEAGLTFRSSGFFPFFSNSRIPRKNVLHLLTQKVPVPLGRNTAVQILEDLAHWSCHIPNGADIIEAINIQERNKLSFWDAMIICSAKAYGCGVIWSEDLTHGQVYEGIKVLNPFI